MSVRPQRHPTTLPRARLTLWLAALLLAACGRTTPGPATPPAPTSEAGPTANATANASPAVEATPEATATPVPTPAPQVFTIGLVETPGTLDPANAIDESALLITRHIYDGLTSYVPGTTEPQPALAESWDVSADGLTWTFQLRSGVSFSDGTALTAAVAQQNFERWLLGRPPGRYLFWRGMFGGFAGEADPEGEPLSLVDTVTASGELMLVVTLNRPAASLPNTLAMPSFALVGLAGLDQADPTSALNAASAGTGPYVLAGWPQPDLVRLARNPAHWDAARASGPDELVFKIIRDDTQRLLALQTGEIEALARLNPADYEAVMAGTGNTRLDFDPALNVLYLGFNQARTPWQNLDCRLAVAYALDMDRYLRDHFPGDAEPAVAMQPPSVWGYSAAGERGYDPDLARERWQACRDSGTIIPAEITLYVPPVERPYLPDPAGVGLAIQSDLAAVGISVTVTAPDWQTAWLPAVHSGQADLFLLGWTGVNGDPDSFLCPLFCGAEGAFNTDEEGDPLPPDAELASLLLEAQQVTEPARRSELYAQAHARIFETVPAVPLAHRKTAWAFRADVLGNIPSPIESLFYDLRLAP